MRRPWIWALMALTTVLSGCQQERTLKVGLVDTIRVVEADRRTSGLKLEWTAEANEIYLAMSKVKNDKEFQALRDKIKLSNEEWQKMTHAFMKEAVTAVERETAEVAKEKGIDIVVAGNRYMSTIQYFNADDITVEVLYKLER